MVRFRKRIPRQWRLSNIEPGVPHLAASDTRYEAEADYLVFHWAVRCVERLLFREEVPGCTRRRRRRPGPPLISLPRIGQAWRCRGSHAGQLRRR